MVLGAKLISLYFIGRVGGWFSQSFSKKMLHIFFYIHFFKLLKRLYLKRQSEYSALRPDTSNLVIIMMFKLASDQRFFSNCKNCFKNKFYRRARIFNPFLKIRMLSTFGEALRMWVLLATVEFYSMRCSFPVELVEIWSDALFQTMVQVSLLNNPPPLCLWL